MLREAGLPEEWCQAALLPDNVATRLVTDPRVAFFSFIGSARVGWMPFAGLGQSGLGTGGIPYTMCDMQVEKMMVLRSQAW
jgi:acyl-CoA reductase-like NAD-dependent aldehyde dehydrogenase